MWGGGQIDLPPAEIGLNNFIVEYFEHVDTCIEEKYIISSTNVTEDLKETKIKCMKVPWLAVIV